MKSLNVQSFDDGYGDLKCDSGTKVLRVPTAYADWRPLPKDNFGNDEVIDKDEFTNPLYKYISYKGNEGEFIVGESALKQSMDINWYGGDNKHEDIGFPIMLKTCLGLMSEGESSVLDLLVMGLPCDKDSEFRYKLLEKLVLNHHKMEIGLSDGSTVKKDIHVKNLIVKKQPFGSFCDVLLDDNGKIANKDLANQFVTVVDIGSRTLNVYTINKMEEVDDLIDTTNNGMYTSYMRVGKYIKHNMGFNVPTGKLPLIIKEAEFQGYDLSPIINKSHERLAYEIKKVLDTMLVQAYGYIGQIIFTGGGSEVLKKYLCQLFHNKDVIFLDRYATARGLRKFGLFKAKKMFPESTASQSKKSVGQGVSFKVGSNYGSI